MNIIPEQFRLMATVLVVIALSGAVATAGFKMGQAQQIAVCATQKDQLQKKIDALAEAVILIEQDRSSLKLALGHANHAVDLLKAQSDASDQARLEAERQVAEIKKVSESRIQKLAAAKQASAGCADMLDRYWEMRN